MDLGKVHLNLGAFGFLVMALASLETKPVPGKTPYHNYCCVEPDVLLL